MCCVAALAVGCEAHGTCNQELARCDCPNGRGGAACDDGNAAPPPGAMAGDALCLNDCNHLGTCIFGFCHCKPGHFGSDCSLYLVEPGTHCPPRHHPHFRPLFLALNNIT